jgi:hypothetical protein
MTDPRAECRKDYGGKRAPRCGSCANLKPHTTEGCYALGERATHTRCSFYVRHSDGDGALFAKDEVRL